MNCRMLSDLTTLIDTSILESLPPDSDQQQALITAVQDFDGYNWGYVNTTGGQFGHLHMLKFSY